MNIHSKITGREYDPADMYYTKNPMQVYAFLFHDANLYDLYCSGEQRITYVFNKSEIDPLRKLWDEYKLVCK